MTFEVGGTGTALICEKGAVSDLHHRERCARAVSRIVGTHLIPNALRSRGPCTTPSAPHMPYFTTSDVRDRTAT